MRTIRRPPPRRVCRRLHSGASGRPRVPRRDSPQEGAPGLRAAEKRRGRVHSLIVPSAEDRPEPYYFAGSRKPMVLSTTETPPPPLTFQFLIYLWLFIPLYLYTDVYVNPDLYLPVLPFVQSF